MTALLNLEMGLLTALTSGEPYDFPKLIQKRSCKKLSPALQGQSLWEELAIISEAQLP